MQPGLGKARPRRGCRHGIVGEVPSRHTSQPLPLLRDRQMPPSLELVFDFAQLGSHPFRDGDALPHESPALGFAARVRKAKAVSLLPAARGRPLLQAPRPQLPEWGGGCPPAGRAPRAPALEIAGPEERERRSGRNYYAFWRSGEALRPHAEPMAAL